MTEKSPTMQVLTGGKGSGAGESAGSGTATQKKAPVKKKTAAATKVVSDLILDTVEQLENLTSEQAIPMARELMESTGFNNFKLGGLLNRISEEGWWDDGECESFKAYINQEFGLGFRKAAYLMNIYTALVESGVKWEQVKALGWTKLRELVSILTPDNVDEWVEKAKDMTVIQLQEYIKAAKQNESKGPDAPPKEEPKKVTTKTFKLHEDQVETVETALARAREEGETEFDAVALDYICMRYLSNDTGKAKKAAPAKIDAAAFQKLGAEEVLSIFEKAFPNFNIAVELPEE